jgi:hypothetical protein
MAIDTRDKRSNCLNVGRPWVFSGPVADGSLATQADRQHIDYAYRGILAGGAPSTVIGVLEKSFHRFITGGMWRRIN